MKAELIDYMGSDLTVVNSARVSFDKRVDEMDKRGVKLIHYLADHGHWTPFAHPQITIRETVPIFVARQRFKHMVGFVYNEVSRRYVDDEPTFYVPVAFRSRPDGGIKQGSGDSIGEESEYWKGYLDRVHELSLQCYTDMLKAGIAPEQARMCLPQSMYTSYYVTGSLAAWARAYKQRIDPHAQAEIRELAQQWASIIFPLFPESWHALTKEA